MTSAWPDSRPFLRDSARPRVHVAHGADAYATTRAALAGLDLTPARGRRVLLKPNAGRVAPRNGGVTTNPDVVAAAIDAFREAGADVAVGESPITGVKALEAFDAIGITEAARQRNCPLLDLDARRPVRIPVPNGQAITELTLCAAALEFDIIVSLPVMKMHMHTGVTLAVKNMKGCLWKRSKVDLHMLAPLPGVADKPLNVAITDLSGVLRPHLSIIDGSVGMEGLGPSAGTAKRLDVVVVGADAFAADAVACSLMGLEAADIPHLRLGAERGYGVIDLARIRIAPAHWRKWARPFAAPPRNLELAFPHAKILDCQSCSACQSTLLLFLRRYGEKLFDYFPRGARPVLAIGRGHETLAGGTLCIGNCTARHRQGNTFVPGCPPVGSAILGALADEAQDDTKDGRGDPGRKEKV